MGYPKAVLRFEGETFLDRLIGCFSGICVPVIVVLGYHAEQVRAGFRRCVEAHIVINPQPERGMLSSLQCGLAAAPQDADSFLFTPVDLPRITRATIETLAITSGRLVIPVFEGRKGHPVRISREIASEILALPTEGQAGDVIRRHEAQLIEVCDPGVLYDVDTPQEYDALVSGVSG